MGKEEGGRDKESSLAWAVITSWRALKCRASASQPSRPCPKASMLSPRGWLWRIDDF
jgi:hypothetical protein